MGSLRKWLGMQDSGVEASAWADRPTSPSEDGRTDPSADEPAPIARPRPVSLRSKTVMKIVSRRAEVSSLKLDQAVRRFHTPDPFRGNNRQRRLAS